MGAKLEKFRRDLEWLLSFLSEMAFSFNADTYKVMDGHQRQDYEGICGPSFFFQRFFCETYV